MRTTWSILVPSLLGVGAAAADAPTWTSKVKIYRNGNYPLDVVDKFEYETMTKVEAYVNRRIAAGTNNGCTLENAAVRREWSDLSVPEREDYVRAVQCLMKLPGKVDKKVFPGAVSRFDDFVAYHMTHAQELHDYIHLFAAHKYYLWVYEKALRDECGYKGYQPYMNYDRYTKDPKNSPLFNGNSSSMGGNGEPDPNYKGVEQKGRTPNLIASGGGGGCVTSGPFSDMVVSLGPVVPTYKGVPKNPLPNGRGANPRCLRRDINVNAALGATADHVYALLNQTTMDNFYDLLLGSPPPKNDPYPWGVHTSGHYIHAVDPGGDPATSPGDPVFYFHHGMLDRIWWIWQMQDPEKRLNLVPNKTRTATPPSHNHGKRADVDPFTVKMDLEWLAPSIMLTEANDQLGGNGGAFCYVYV